MRITKSITIIIPSIMLAAFCITYAMAEEPVVTTFSYGAQWGPGGKPAFVKQLEKFYRDTGNPASSIFFEDYGMSRDWNDTTKTPVDVTNVFTSHVPRIYCWNSVSQVVPGTAVTFNWYSPLGTLFESSTETLSWSGYGWVTSALNLESAASASRAIDISGVWHVDVEAGGEVIHQQNFAIDALLPILVKPRISRGGFLGSQNTVRDSGVVKIGSSTMTADPVSSVFSRAQASVVDANGATIWIPIGNLAQTGERTTESSEREVSHEINIPVGITPQGRLPADLIKIISRDRDRGGNIGVWPNFEIQ